MFTEMSKTDLELEVVLGDDTVVRSVGQGTVCFDRESTEPHVTKECFECPWDEEESCVSFHDRGQRPWGICPRW